MIIAKKVLLLRSGDRQDGETKTLSLANSRLSSMGRFQMSQTYKKISHYITIKDIVDIYCPHSKSAIESTEIIRDLFFNSGIRIRNIKKDERLFSDPFLNYHPNWIKEELVSSTATAIIIVAHIELVRWFPKDLGKPQNYSKAGEGIFLNNGDIENIILDES